MLRSLYSAVSGLQANQTMMDVVGNDIANVNTTGYKSNDVEFADLLSQTIAGASAPTSTVGGINPEQVGLGVRIAGTATNFTQGTAQNTGKPTDVSINGDGFLIGSSNGQTLYTRAGSLSLDANGNLVTPDGMLIQGWPASVTGSVTPGGPLSSLTIPAGKQVPATATQNLLLAGNVAQSGTTNPSTSVNVYDSLGNQSTLNLSFAPAAGGWQVTGTDNGTTVGTATIPFDATNGTASSPTVTLGGYTLNVSGLTATAGPATVSVTNQDGAPSGTLQSFSIAPDGVITGAFSNGKSQALGEIALANFANPGGLERAGNTDFRATPNSGLPQIGAAGSGGRGLLSPGTLEMSNVDLGQEFTNLIVAQRGFEANGKVITSSDQLLQTLINMKQ